MTKMIKLSFFIQSCCYMARWKDHWKIHHAQVNLDFGLYTLNVENFLLATGNFHSFLILPWMNKHFECESYKLINVRHKTNLSVCFVTRVLH